MDTLKRTLFQEKAILLNEELCRRYRNPAPCEGTAAMQLVLKSPSEIGGENDYRIDRDGVYHRETRFGREGAGEQYNPSFAVGGNLPED